MIYEELIENISKLEAPFSEEWWPEVTLCIDEYSESDCFDEDRLKSLLQFLMFIPQSSNLQKQYDSKPMSMLIRNPFDKKSGCSQHEMADWIDILEVFRDQIKDKGSEKINGMFDELLDSMKDLQEFDDEALQNKAC